MSGEYLLIIPYNGDSNTFDIICNKIISPVQFQKTLKIISIAFFPMFFTSLQEMGVIIYNQDMSKEYLKHEEIQSKMELVLICISISAVILALILLTVLR